jgi:ribosomal-protein-alanine N-acetyltransferase
MRHSSPVPPALSSIDTLSLLVPARRTVRLWLRPLMPEDREEYIRMHRVSAAHFRPYMAAAEPGTTHADMFSKELEQSVQGEEKGTLVRRAAFLQDGRMAGLFSLSQIYRGAFQNCYAGWRVNVEVTGQGICTEGMAAMLEVAFALPPAGLGLHRVQANIIPGNAPSIRVAEKLGFRREGLALGYLKIAGHWQDHLMFAKLADEP